MRSICSIGATDVWLAESEIAFDGFWLFSVSLGDGSWTWLDSSPGASVSCGPSEGAVFSGFGRYMVACPPPPPVSSSPSTPRTLAPASAARPMTRPTTMPTPTRASSP